MKIALILYGQTRFIDRDSVIESHQKDILSKYDTDVYAHMWFDQDHNYGEISSWAASAGTVLTIPIDSPQIVLEKYKPIRLQIDKPDTYEVSEGVKSVLDRRFSKNPYYSTVNMSNIISQAISLDRACNLVYTDKQYDFCVLARYDAILTGFPKLDTLDKKLFHIPIGNGSGFSDLIHVFSDKFLNPSPFTGLADRIMNDEKMHEEVDHPIPETYKFINFRDNFEVKDLVRMGMDGKVIRK